MFVYCGLKKEANIFTLYKSVTFLLIRSYGRMALKHVNYHMWNESPVQVRYMIQGAQRWCTGMTQRDGMGREVRGWFGMENTCTLMVDSSQCMAKSIQYYKK